MKKATLTTKKLVTTKRIVIVPDDVSSIDSAMAYSRINPSATILLQEEDDEEKLVEKESQLEEYYGGYGYTGRAFLLTQKNKPKLDNPYGVCAYVHQIDFLIGKTVSTDISRGYIKNMHEHASGYYSPVKESVWRVRLPDKVYDNIDTVKRELTIATPFIAEVVYKLANNPSLRSEREEFGITGGIMVDSNPRNIDGGFEERKNRIDELCGEIVMIWYVDVLGNIIWL